MNLPVTIFKNVFTRENPATRFTFHDYLNSPEKIFEHFGLDIDSCLNKVEFETDKIARNTLKRELLPAMDISPAYLFAIDIDGISNSETRKNHICDNLRGLKPLAVKESVSGNLVAFFRFAPSVPVDDFKFLYYKTYLESTLFAGVNIDFLPEINRLRYVGRGGYMHLDLHAEEKSDLLNVGTLPTINTHVTPDGARRQIYKSL